jgi:glycopeptide antibiotics resistance protein
VFWFPFDFRTDGAFLRERLHNFMTRVPFEAYYYGTEFRAITEVLHKVLFFIPLGALLAWFVSGLRWTWRGHGTFLSLVLIAVVSLGAVAGRLAQADKNPDSMDMVLQWLGGALGFVMIKVILSRKMPAVQPRRSKAFSQDEKRYSSKKRRIQIKSEGG